MVEKTVEGRRQKIAAGESADVYLLPEPRPDGSQVVRVEKRDEGTPTLIKPQEAFIVYYTMKLAQLLYPEHVIKMTALEPYRKVGSGVMPRPPHYFSKYYPLPKESEREIHEIRDKIREASKLGIKLTDPAAGELNRGIKAFDGKMRERYPDLIPASKKLEAAGFVVPHPEVNFTVHDGKIMFYEVQLQHFDARNFAPIVDEMFRQAGQKSRGDARKLFIKTIRNLCKLSVLGFHYRRGITGKELDALVPTLGTAQEKHIIDEKEAASLHNLLTGLYDAYRENKPEKTRRLLEKMIGGRRK